MSKAIRTIQCNTAEELLKELAPSNSLWGSGPTFWVFRGHEDDCYQLIPSALRSTAKLGYVHNELNGPQRTNEEQVHAELKRLEEFFWLVDREGLQIPGDDNIIRDTDFWNSLLCEIRCKGWPRPIIQPLMAIAQHYGVHTRLLDWSGNPMVAAYFAAIGAVKKETHNLGIWALNLDWVIIEAFNPNDKKPPPKLAVYVVTAPRASNPFLHAQSGVFTTEPVTTHEMSLRVHVQTVDKIVRSRFKVKPSGQPVMIHFVLPSGQSGKLLRLLYDYGVSAASVFPGYKGVAKAMKEHLYWDDTQKRSSYFLDDR